MSPSAENRNSGKDPKRLYTAYQVADLLGATPGAVMDWMQKGWLPYKRLPDGPVRISEKGLLKFLKGRGVAIELVMAKAVLRDQERRRKRGESPDTPLANAKPLPLPAFVTAAAEHQPESEEAQTMKTHDEPFRDDAKLRDDVTDLESEALLEMEASPINQPPEEMDLGPIDVDEEYRKVSDDERIDTAEPAPPPDSAAAQVADAILRDAVSSGASHVHLSAGEQGLDLRMRIRGVLHEKPTFRDRLPKGLAPQLIGRLKSLASLDGEPVRSARSGGFTAAVGGKNVEMQMSVLPTDDGEKMVIRLPRAAVELMSLAELGLGGADEADLRALLAQESGLIVLAAPPRNCAKATLLAMLEEIRTAGRNVVTLEKTIAGQIAGAARTRVDVHGGLSFAEASAALGEQDADVVLIEELRDPATAAEAVEAAVDGALVLASMRASSAVSAVSDLLEMGIEPWPLASVLLAVVAQRSVRKLCDVCKKPLEPDAQSLAAVGLKLSETDGPIFGPLGCDKCAKTGFSGRINLFSMLRTGPSVMAAIRRASEPDVLLEAARQSGAKSLQSAAREAILAGKISPAQCRRALAR